MFIWKPIDSDVSKEIVMEWEKNWRRSGLFFNAMMMQRFDVTYIE
jgi:hypothetical protein